MGVLGLAKRHGAAMVDQACKVALELGAPDYRVVRKYLERVMPARNQLRQVDTLIRELHSYRDFIDAKTATHP